MMVVVTWQHRVAVVVGDVNVAGDNSGGGDGGCQRRDLCWLVLVDSMTMTALPLLLSSVMIVVVNRMGYAPGPHPLHLTRTSPHPSGSLCHLWPCWWQLLLLLCGGSGGGDGGKHVGSVVGMSVVGKRAAGADCGLPASCMGML